HHLCHLHSFPTRRSSDLPEILLYTRLRKSPYFHASGRHGVEAYSVVNHQYHPRRYGDPINEYWTLVNDVTLWDVGAERQVEITGDRKSTRLNSSHVSTSY